MIYANEFTERLGERGSYQKFSFPTILNLVYHTEMHMHNRQNVHKYNCSDNMLVSCCRVCGGRPTLDASQIR